MKFERDVNNMCLIGAADYVIVLSELDTCLVKVTDLVKFKEDSYIQVIGVDNIYELYATEMDYPVEPQIIAVGDGASKKLGRLKHKVIHINNWRAM